MSLLVAWDARLVAGTGTGDSTYWTGLLDAMGRIGGDVRFILLSDRPAPDGFRPDDRFDWRTVPAKSSRWWSFVAFPMGARRAGADLVHVQYSLSPLVRSAAVTTVHDVSFFLGPEWFRPRDRALMRATVPAACRRAKRVITVSESSRREIESFVPSARGKVAVTPLACPPWIRAVDRKVARARVRERFGLESFLLTVGTRWPRKNMSLAVQAVEGLSDAYPQRLALTGKAGWGERDLGRRGVATGYVDAETLSCLYSAADLYLAPSRHEGFGFPVLEAYRCGCPVICSHGGAFPETAGDAAKVMNSWDPPDWTAAVQKLLDDPGNLDSLRKRGFAREREFDWEETARKTLAVYHEAVT